MKSPRFSSGPAVLRRAAAVLVSALAAPFALAATPATAEFRFDTQTLTVPAGFTVELVAAPPTVNRPISVAFDERGRLYVTDSSGLSDRAPVQFEQKPHRVVRLEDADGDGRFEKSTVFADRMMFPQGALFYEGSLYVAAPPHIWKLTDTDDDGVADRREVWYDGKTLTGCGNDVHGPYLGPDGWFYWTKGAFAEQRHTLPDGRPFVTRAAHIFRSRPDGSGLEPVLTGGMDNPVGVAFSTTGERFLSGTFFQIGVAGKRDGLIHAIYGGVYGKEQAALAGHVRTGDLLPIMTHMGAAAPCGSTVYRSDAAGFGAEFTDNLFVCYFNLRKISRHELAPDGATFTTRDTDFVTSSSPDFRPTDVLEDADGSLLIVDTGGWYKICCPTSQLAKPDVLGGIYRIRRTGAPAARDPRGLRLDWASASPTDLAARLGHSSPEIQDRAVHLLGKTGAAAVPPLRALLTDRAASPVVRRNAVWALTRIAGAEAQAAIRVALRDADASVTLAAVHAVSLARDHDAIEALRELLTRPDAALVRLAAEALGRIGDARATPWLLAAAAQLGETAFTSSGSPEAAGERILEHALIHALIEIGQRDAVRPHLAIGAQPRAARAALVALSGIPEGLRADEILPWLESADARLKQTAAWIMAQHPEWGGALAHYFQQRLQRGAADDRQAEEFLARITPLAAAPEIQALLGATAADASTPTPARRLALRAMTAARPKETPAAWLDALAAALGSRDAALAREAVAAARALPMPKNGHTAFGAALVRLGRDAGAPADMRLEALAAAPAAAFASLEPAVFEFLRGQLDARQPTLLRGYAAAVLAKAPLAPAQQLALAETVRSVGPLELPKLLPAFERRPSEDVGRRLLAALRESRGMAGVRPNVLKNAFAKYPPAVRQEAEALIAQINRDAAAQNARIDELLAAAKDGDIRRGQAVFNSDKTACTLCHVIGYHGGRLGPDLTNIGRIRSDRELLEAIVYPSATFVRGYEPMIVTTKSGEQHTGILHKDAPDEVVLATGPDAEQRIARADITDLQPGVVSPMPPGLDAVLSRQELADLLAFLVSRR